MATISHLFHINASQEEVFNAISSIQGLRKWWTDKATGDDTPKGIIEFNFSPGTFIKFRVDQINPNSYYRWVCVDADPQWIGTIAEFKLSRVDGKTKVEFFHSGWAEQTAFFANCNFSWARYFISLRDYLEKGSGAPYKED